jgi:hypothetical protein
MKAENLFKKILGEKINKVFEEEEAPKSEPSKSYEEQQEENIRLFNIVDPETGLRYDIPMLKTTAPDYFWQYIHFMKIKEKDPDLFQKILDWE